MRVLALLALCLAAVSAVPKNPQRIVGGTVTTISQYPSMAALLYSPGVAGHRQSCGGTIINQRSVLTAAHCTINDAPARWRIRLGSTFANSGGNIYDPQQIINHPNYNANTFNNDIAILRCSYNFAVNNNVRAAPVAGSNYNLADNQVVWATGWGTVSSGGPASEQLRQVQIWTVNQNTCAQRYAEVGMTITANMLCSGWLDVGGRDQCQGDSGGPLYHNGNLVGVCSFGWGCAQARYPGVNARVSIYSTWIQSNA